mgnify:CR=1 FL=1
MTLNARESGRLIVCPKSGEPRFYPIKSDTPSVHDWLSHYMSEMRLALELPKNASKKHVYNTTHSMANAVLCVAWADPDRYLAGWKNMNKNELRLAMVKQGLIPTRPQDAEKAARFLYDHFKDELPPGWR